MKTRCVSVCACSVDSRLRGNDGEGRAGNDRDGTTLPLWIADQVRNDSVGVSGWIPAYAGMTVRDARVMTGQAQPCPSGLRIKSAMTV